jgi:hypothetical protein
MKKMIVVSIALAAMTTPAFATNHALIMGVENYLSSPLHGVPKDRESARAIAKSMGVPEENIVERSDAELTLGGLRSTLRQFQQKVRPGDRVFIYYSGHGTSRAGKSGDCEQGIVTQEMSVLSKDEFYEYLKPIRNQAAKTVVFLDTCFSGGVVLGAKGGERSFGDSEPQPKFWQAKLTMSNDSCGKPSNYAKGTRDFVDIQAAQATPNYYLLGASGPDEYAIDGGPVHGSYATTAFLDCLKPEVGADTNRDGIISLEEARICAQGRVSGQLRPPFLRQTLTVGEGAGGGATPIAFGASSSSASNSAASSSNAAISSAELLSTIHRNADQKQTVSLRSLKSAYRVGQDYLELEVKSSKGGYLTLLSVGSSGRIFQLFPNALDDKNRIEANSTLRLPRPEWRVPAGGPAGKNRFLAVVSSTPNLFANLGVPVAGRFKAIDGTNANAKDIIERLISPAAECKASSVRDFDSPELSPCASSYGAGLVDVMEVN